MMLSKHLNDNHPIHDKLNKLSALKLNDLKKILKIKAKKDLKMSIANHFFIKHSESPLTELEKVLSQRLLEQNIDIEIDEIEKQPVPNKKKSPNEQKLQSNDYSVQVPNDRDMVIDKLSKYMLVRNYVTKRLQAALSKKLREKHPIHDKLRSLPNADLYKLCEFQELNIIIKKKDRTKVLKAIADKVFEYERSPPSARKH